MLWTKKTVIKQLQIIKNKGYISIPNDMYRNDDGIVGQILEREFNVSENNLHIADLGTYELKGMRIKKNKNNLTLFHQTSSSGLTPIQIFERFGYERKSKRDENIIKRKLFTTIKGTKHNNLGLILKAGDKNNIELFFNDEYLSTWDLTKGIKKISQVLLVLAKTDGDHNSTTERFHYYEAFILSDPKDIYEAINNGSIIMDLCIDQPIDHSKPVHDRGPHIRILLNKLSLFYNSVEKVL